jgi:hypothetical protein
MIRIVTDNSSDSSRSILEHERLTALHLGLPIEWYTNWRLQGVPHSVLAWLEGGNEDFLSEYTALAKGINSGDLAYLATPLFKRNWQGAFRSDYSFANGYELLLLALEIRRLGISVEGTPAVLHAVLSRLNVHKEFGYTYDAVVAVVYLCTKAKILLSKATEIVSEWTDDIDIEGESAPLDRAKILKTLTVDYGVPLETASKFLMDIPLDLLHFEEQFLSFDEGKRSDPDDVFAELTAFSSIELCSRYVDEIAKILLSPKTRHTGAWYIYLTLLKLEGFKPLN